MGVDKNALKMPKMKHFAGEALPGRHCGGGQLLFSPHLLTPMDAILAHALISVKFVFGAMKKFAVAVFAQAVLKSRPSKH